MARPNCPTRYAEAAARGRDAEAAAAGYLEARNFRVLLRNYRCRMGELDIVALAPDGTLVLAEVRLRSRQDYGGGAASVDHRKQQRLLRAGRHLLATRPQWSHHALRFDVLDIRRQDDRMEINWIQHAFGA